MIRKFLNSLTCSRNAVCGQVMPAAVKLDGLKPSNRSRNNAVEGGLASALFKSAPRSGEPDRTARAQGRSWLAVLGTAQLSGLHETLGFLADGWHQGAPVRR